MKTSLEKVKNGPILPQQIDAGLPHSWVAPYPELVKLPPMAANLKCIFCISSSNLQQPTAATHSINSPTWASAASNGAEQAL